MNIQEYFLKLDDNAAETLDAAMLFSQTQLQEKPEGKWSVLEILEHILLTEKLIHKIVQMPTDAKASTDELLSESKMQHLLIEKRAIKIEAPEFLHPKGNIKEVEDFKKAFLERRNLLKEQINNHQIVIDNRVQKHPTLGEMTITDWLHFMPLHTQRHVIQIKERL